MTPFTKADHEAAARIIAPGRWAVMDTEKAAMLRKYKGQHVGYDPEQFKDAESMNVAERALNAAYATAQQRGAVGISETGPGGKVTAVIIRIGE